MNLPLTIKETQAGLMGKKFKAAEIVREYLERIKKHDQGINAFLTISEEQAFEAAAKVDRLLENSGKDAFSQYPLLGVSLALKDLFLTKGIRTTAGSKVLESYVPAYSATVVTKLEKAGTILIGKTNCDAWAHGASGENSDFRPTKNPWQPEFVPGGSSSGSAAAIAANFSLIATGTDTGGSIRQPANFCGVVGLKPTYGAVSRYGIIAMASSLDSVGHFARTVNDARRVFEVTKGEDGLDSTVKNASPQKPKSSKLRIGIPREYFAQGLDKEVEKSVFTAAHVLEKEGVELVEVSLPHTKYAISVYYIVQPAEVSSNLGRYDGIRYGNGRNSFGAEAKRRIMLGSYVLSSGYYDAYYLKAMKVRSKIIQDFEQAFDNVDAILAPVSPTPPFALGEKADNPLQMYLADILTVAGNLAGIPGLAIPSGFTKKGLPLGFQLLGPRFSEETLFSLGERYQQSTDYQPKVAI
ncbi:Asp-tRNA(Asn)/Glu-tRNA(Gln) amidotransferase subunit GatA [Candidatus Woesebacteria bacterium]|nr:Asp-tRNA(Asn)/Glu-tRNA(Gln) amidotransferase subunit GatA [Candidatus Woesebacteria bacterium]